jgi:hypothetical protein
MGYGVGHRTYHTSVVRGPITKGIPTKTPMMLEEATLAIDQYIGSPPGKHSVSSWAHAYQSYL